MRQRDKALSVIYIILGLAGLGQLLLSAPDSFAAQEPVSTSTQPVVVSGEGAVVVTPTPSAILAPKALAKQSRPIWNVNIDIRLGTKQLF